MIFPTALDQRAITNDHVYRKAQKASASGSKNEKASVGTRTSASRTEDASREESEVSSQESTTDSDGGVPVPQAHLGFQWQESSQPHSPGLLQGEHTTTASDAGPRMPQQAHLEYDWQGCNGWHDSGLSQPAHPGNTTEDDSDAEP